MIQISLDRFTHSYQTQLFTTTMSLFFEGGGGWRIYTVLKTLFQDLYPIGNNINEWQPLTKLLDIKKLVMGWGGGVKGVKCLLNNIHYLYCNALHEKPSKLSVLVVTKSTQTLLWQEISQLGEGAFISIALAHLHCD